MRYEFQLTIAIEFDAVKIAVEKCPRYTEGLKDSISEFAEELRAFIEKHPLVEGCKLKTNVVE